MVVVVLNMVKCLPFSNNWTIMPIEKFCVSFMQEDVFLASTVANVSTDVLGMYIFNLDFGIYHPLIRCIKSYHPSLLHFVYHSTYN